MKRVPLLMALFCMVIAVFAAAVGRVENKEGEANPLFKEIKIKNYLPHMSWPEVEAALKTTDMVLMPVGSVEQHGRHLPLGTDSLAAIEVCKLIAQQVDAVVAPSVLVGLSEHHMGFPGSLTLRPETFEAVVFETAQSLIRHGFRKICIYNGHGGNSTAVANIIQRINQETPATAVDLHQIRYPQEKSPYADVPFDYHAGVGETSWMLYLTKSLVDMTAEENPEIRLPPDVRSVLDKMRRDRNFAQIFNTMLMRPSETGKKTSMREVSSNGVYTTGDVSDASAGQGKWEIDLIVGVAVRFLREWKSLGGTSPS